jgi:hypothetical protein
MSGLWIRFDVPPSRLFSILYLTRLWILGIIFLSVGIDSAIS